MAEKLRQALKDFPRLTSGPGTRNITSGGTAYSGSYAYSNQGATFSVDTGASWGLQHGGMINEPIWGIGKSGQKYKFGEAGPERITPTGASTRSGDGIGNVVINVNVDSINNDVDLEKIKPIVERALLEVHSRRGII